MSETYVVQVEVEHEIIRISDTLEQATGKLAEVLDDWANAEADFKVAFAKAYRDCPEKTPEHMRRQIATVCTADLLRASLNADATKTAMQEKCRQLRAQLDAMRTLSANVRVQT